MPRYTEQTALWLMVPVEHQKSYKIQLTCLKYQTLAACLFVVSVGRAISSTKGKAINDKIVTLNPCIPCIFVLNYTLSPTKCTALL